MDLTAHSHCMAQSCPMYTFLFSCYHETYLSRAKGQSYVSKHAGSDSLASGDWCILGTSLVIVAQLINLAHFSTYYGWVIIGAELCYTGQQITVPDRKNS